MIEKIHIQNFKSIYDLKIDVGRVNLIIGENGSGKSNLLEALVFVSATKSSKVDNGVLSACGLRVPKPSLMRSSFETNNKDILIEITFNGESISSSFYNDNKEYSNWMLDERILNHSNDNIVDTLNAMLESKRYNEKKYLEKLAALDDDKITDILKILSNIQNNSKLENFLIYSPENTALRTFEKEGQILPLGINGEGLLKLLKVVNNYEDTSYINTIIKSLQLFDWFENITIPDSLSSGEDKVIIKDKYLYEEIDQRSTNEGFLFILFYITLIVARETPKAFAIDNVDASLNPKLCTKLMTIIIDLAKKYDKQIFLTTHNPSILDGIDLFDDEQRLFVVSRSDKGHTKTERIEPPKDTTKEDWEEQNYGLKLSDIWLSGAIGGIPKGF
ncbi:MAG: AAA family ATPase [Arcobacteraceae bacterium]